MIWGYPYFWKHPNATDFLFFGEKHHDIMDWMFGWWWFSRLLLPLSSIWSETWSGNLKDHHNQQSHKVLRTRWLVRARTLEDLSWKHDFLIAWTAMQLHFLIVLASIGSGRCCPVLPDLKRGYDTAGANREDQRKRPGRNWWYKSNPYQIYVQI